MLDLIIKNGKIVNADQSLFADVAVKDGKIVSIGDSDYFTQAAKVVDAKNMLVLPGLIDSHVHINMELGEFTSLDKFEDASIAAAYGGMTSMVEFSIPVGKQTPMDALENSMKKAQGKSVIDYSFHGCVTKADAVSLSNVKDMLTGGISSIKMFTIYRNLVMLEMMGIVDVLRLVKKYDGIAKIHAECAPLIEAMIQKHVEEGKTTPFYHAKSRPAYSESAAVASLIPIIEETGAPTIFVHMTTSEVREYIAAAKKFLPVFTEFCPHYLTLTEEVYEREDAQNFVCSPPMRSKEDQDGLWKMISDGLCDIISSDHSSYDTKQKKLHKGNFPRIPNGLPGIETRGMVIFSEGVGKGRMTENQFVSLLSTNDAKLMGMYPQKGAIKPGSDADIVVYDPSRNFTMHAKDLHMATDYTPFENFTIKGKPIHTIVRGHVVIENENFTNLQTKGEFIKRHAPDLL